MRHRLEGRKFGRQADQRKAMLRNLVKSLVISERITTTVAKAKEMRSIAERVITYGKKGEVHHRRLAYRYLGDRGLVKKVFDEIAPRYKDVKGGYTRIIKKGFRKGDAAAIAIIEFVSVKVKKISGKAKENIKIESLEVEEKGKEKTKDASKKDKK